MSNIPDSSTQPTTATASFLTTAADSGAQTEKTLESEPIQKLNQDDKNTRVHDPSEMDVIARQHLNRETKQPIFNEIDPSDTTTAQRSPAPKDTTLSSNRTTNLCPKRKADSDTNEIDLPNPSSSDSFKARKKEKQWKRKQRKVGKMHQWKQEAGLDDTPS